MAEQICPVCGCPVGEGAYEKDGKAYCCEPCATGSVCVCGCCSIGEVGEAEGGGAEG